MIYCRNELVFISIQTTDNEYLGCCHDIEKKNMHNSCCPALQFSNQTKLSIVFIDSLEIVPRLAFEQNMN